MATEVVSVIDPGGGGDFTTIAAWESDAGVQKDLVAADEIQVGELVSGEHTIASAVAITGATTNASCYRVLRAQAGAEYDPASGSGAYLRSTLATGYTIQAREEGLRLENFGISTGGATSSTTAPVLFSTDSTNSNDVAITVDGLSAFTDRTGSGDNYGWFISSPGFPVVLRNCVIYGAGAGTTITYGALITSADPVTIENCDFYGASYRGVQMNSDLATHSFRNIVSANCGNADFNWGAATNITVEYCASEDLTADDAGGTGNITGIAPEREFVDPRFNNFVVRQGGSLAGAGVKIDAFSTDIRGRGYDPDSWNIGAYASVNTQSPLTRTHTIGTGGDYATIALWEADTDNDLVAFDVVEVGELLNEEHDTAGGLLSGATTNASCYRVLRAQAGAEYDPITGTGAIAYASGHVFVLPIQEEGFRLQGIGVRLEGTQTSARGCVLVFNDSVNANGVGAQIDRCAAIHGSVSDYLHKGFDIRVDSLLAPATLRNCVAIGDGGGTSTIGNGFDLLNTGDVGVTVDNCVAYGCSQYGFRFEDDVASNVARNCVAVNSTTSDFVAATGSTNFTASNCASSDATADDFGGAGNIINITPWKAFMAPGLGDFRPQSRGPLHEAGKNLSSSFTTDFTGNAYGAKWNIGAYGTSVINGLNKADDIRVITITFGAANDYAYIDTTGYDYAVISPALGGGTAPSSGEMFITPYAADVGSGAIASVANIARLPDVPGVQTRASVTSTAAKAGYISILPKHLVLLAALGSGWSDLDCRVELRKEKIHGQAGGRA